MSKKTNKKRRLKKGKTKRLFIIISIILAISLIGGLFYISLNHFDNQKQTKQKTTKSIKKEEKVNIKQESKNNKKEIKKQTIKFNKDENLSKIFLEPKNNDETYALKQAKQESKNHNPQPKIDKNSTKIDTNSTKLDTKPATILALKDINKTIIANPKPIEKSDQNLKKDINKTKQTTNKDSTKQVKFKKPKLVIIIDDVANKSHVSMIKSTALKLTPSFFPKNEDHPDTPKLADEFEFFMIHLPMQANSFHNAEKGTLKISDDIKTIDKKIKQIRADFPKVKFINNHTGSKFTSDFNAMDKIYKIFLKYNFIFMDSRTISTTKVKSVAQKYKLPYIVRDVFLDDKDDKIAIKTELLSAIEKSKQKGYAIAIGHPRKNTIDVLKQNRELILKNVELVYLRDIYEFYR